MSPEQQAKKILFGNPDRRDPVHDGPYIHPETFESILYSDLVKRIAGTPRIYIAGPMRNIPEFNFPAFHAAEKKLRAEGFEVFNPAAKDNERHGVDISKGNTTGDESVAAEQHGFNLREALALDLDFICRQATHIALLPGWRNSKGATAEHATAIALGLEVIELESVP